jgi:hypothetical protein
VKFTQGAWGTGEYRYEDQARMKTGLAAALGLALAATVTSGALAQSPWPASPQQSAAPAAQGSPGQGAPAQSAPWPSASPPAAQGAPAQSAPWPGSSPQQSGFPSGQQNSVFGAPQGQPAAQCANFPKLRDDAAQKANLVQEIGKKHGDRAAMCTAVTRFFEAEQKVVKFLEDNKTACGVPNEAVQQAKVIHGNTQKFKDTVCAEGPKPKIPTLSDAITTTPVDTPKNTKTGPGTFNTLTGNPLGN